MANTLSRCLKTHPAMAECAKPGLQALGSDSNCISPSATSKLCGSVDMDACFKDAEPQASRWDYIVCYNGELLAVEIHPANTGEVNAMIAKKQWLARKWADLNLEAECGRIKVYHWVASGKVDVLPQSPQAKRLAQSGLLGPTKLLRLA